MSDDSRDFDALSDAEEEMVRYLARLGPRMRAQEEIEAELDEHFAQGLRAYLVHGEERSPHPRFARELRGRLTSEATSHPLRPRPFRGPLLWGTAAAVAAAVILALLVVLYPRSHVPSINPPYPTRADLLFGFPTSRIQIGQLTPMTSLVHPGSGRPYAGHLRLTAHKLPHEPSELRAYLLELPSDAVSMARHFLGIHAPARAGRVGSQTWAVAAEGGSPSRQPLHSVAVSRSTGELIYHDLRNFVLPRTRRALPAGDAVSIARTWLTHLGWPGMRMPLLSARTLLHRPRVRAVVFGWIGVGATATPAATLWVTPDGSVIEAWVWPPVARNGVVTARSLATAWAEVRNGAVPIAVAGVPPSTRTPGTGGLRRATVVSLLSPARGGRVYLVPAYRFDGTVHIPGASIHRWFGLAPAAQK